MTALNTIADGVGEFAAVVRVKLVTLGAALLLRGRLTGHLLLTHRVGERLEILGDAHWIDLGLDPDQFPATRCGESARVGFAEVITMRFDVGGERSEHSRGIGVDVGQRGVRVPGA